MTRVAPFAQQELLLFHALNTQARMSERQLQLATGKVAQHYAQAAAVSSRLLTLEADNARVSQYMLNIDTFEHRLELANLSLETIDTSANQMLSALNSVFNFPDAHVIELRESAAAARDLVRDMLNVEDGGRYLFAGTRSDTVPVVLSGAGYTTAGLIEANGVTVDESFYQAYYTQTLGNTLPYAQGSFYQQIYFEKNGALPPAPPPPVDPNNPTTAEFVALDPGLFQFYVDRMNSAASLATPKLDYYQGDQGVQTVRADDNQDLALPVRADDTAFAQILAALDAVANLPDNKADTAFERAVVAKARDILSAALGSTTTSYKSLAALRTDVALVQSRLHATKERHQGFSAYAESAIGDIEGIDEAEVITRLQMDRTALEASYSVIAQLNSLSLLDYL